MEKNLLTGELSMIAILLLLGVFVAGFFVGYVSRYTDEQFSIRRFEMEAYCSGYEDGFYLGWGDHDPQVFRKEIAEKAYYEYKGMKYGPEKH